jgi:hypothetical protein
LQYFGFGTLRDCFLIFHLPHHWEDGSHLYAAAAAAAAAAVAVVAAAVDAAAVADAQPFAVASVAFVSVVVAAASVEAAVAAVVSGPSRAGSGIMQWFMDESEY